LAGRPIAGKSPICTGTWRVLMTSSNTTITVELQLEPWWRL
jgi:hypothetical protein